MVRTQGVNGLVSQLVHEDLSWRSLPIGMAWYSVVGREQSRSLDSCNPIIFSDICRSETRQARELQPIIFSDRAGQQRRVATRWQRRRTNGGDTSDFKFQWSLRPKRMSFMRNSTSDWMSSACGTPDETCRHASTIHDRGSVVPTSIAG